VVDNIRNNTLKFRWLLTTFLFVNLALISEAQVTSKLDSANHPTPTTIQIKEVQVSGKTENSNITQGSSGVTINIKNIKQLPKFIGESDPYKALQYMGGVSQSGDANAGLYVRGGNNDQNLILLDGAPIFNPTHVMGMFSVFNPDIIGQLQFYKSGIPAEYGGRLSSVVSMNTNSTIPDSLTVTGSVGLISSKGAFNLPINKNLSIYGALRRSYIGAFILPLLAECGVSKILTNNRYDFYDANAGFSAKLASRTMLKGSYYSGKDMITISDIVKLNFNSSSTYWGNTAYVLTLNHIFNENWSMSHAVDYSLFQLDAKLNLYNSPKNLSTKFGVATYHSDFSYINDVQNIKFGVLLSKNDIYPNTIQSDSTLGLKFGNNSNIIHSNLISGYIRDEITFGNWLFNIGLRGNYYTHIGPYADMSALPSKIFTANEIVQTYSSIEPRFFSRYLIDNSSSIKFSISRHNQFLNQVPVLAVGLPIDIQLPASKVVKPQGSWHYAAGFYKNLLNNKWELSLEGYYKTLENQLEYKNGIEATFSNREIEKSLLTGKGWAYGSELKVTKIVGNLTGWFTYNLAWNYRQFDEINNGKPFFALNDRRHDFSLILMYKLNKRLSFSTVFVYATGKRVNLPVSWFVVDMNLVFEYSNYNALPFPPYHRLDVGVNYKLKKWGKVNSELNFSIYNLYNRANPYQLYLGGSTKQNNVNFEVKMAYLLPIIPSISWTFNF
jgi:hypothetical protein